MVHQFITDPSNAAASDSQPNASTSSYPHYDGPVPIVRGQGAPEERWESLKSQLYGTSGIEEGKNYTGQSILTDWLEQIPDKKSWTCKVPFEGSGGHPCGAEFSRVDRAIVHIRGKHLDMRPYCCGNGGNCQVLNWLVSFSAVIWYKRPIPDRTRAFFSAMAFTSKENRSEHWNPKRITCTQWSVVTQLPALNILLMNAIVVKSRCVKTLRDMYRSAQDAKDNPMGDQVL